MEFSHREIEAKLEKQKATQDYIADFLEKREEVNYLLFEFDLNNLNLALHRAISSIPYSFHAKCY